LTLQGDAERSNRVSAVLREVHWQGELTHLVADIGETIVRVVATRLPNPPSRGDRLDFFFAPGDANLIAENAGV
jgi:2-aminoethylphosphonate transport system ATP-binding protein